MICSSFNKFQKLFIFDDLLKKKSKKYTENKSFDSKIRKNIKKTILTSSFVRRLASNISIKEFRSIPAIYLQCIYIYI